MVSYGKNRVFERQGLGKTFHICGYDDRQDKVSGPARLLGIEYYSGLGTFKKILPIKQQEHLLGPMIDLYIHPMWEINGGVLFGLTENSNQQVLKLLPGRRRGK